MSAECFLYGHLERDVTIQEISKHCENIITVFMLHNSTYDSRIPQNGWPSFLAQPLPAGHADGFSDRFLA